MIARMTRTARNRRKIGVDDLADPDCDFAGFKREEENKCEENGREDEKRDGLAGRIRQHRGHAGRKGRGRASRDCEQGTDGEVQKTREEHAVALADLAR